MAKNKITSANAFYNGRVPLGRTFIGIFILNAPYAQLLLPCY